MFLAIVFAVEMFLDATHPAFFKDARDVRDAVEPFVTILGTALGAAIGFFFADRRR